MDPRRAIPLLVCATLCACGARTGVDVDPPPERHDAGFDDGFDTFPCRWSLTQPALVARDPMPFVQLHGAVHGLRDEVVVLGRTASREGFFGARMQLANPAVRIESVELDARAVHGHRAGWVLLASTGCSIEHVDSELEIVSSMEFDTECFLEPNDPAHLDVTHLAGGVLVTSWLLPDGPMTTTEIVRSPEVTVARSVRLDGSGVIVAAIERGVLRVYRASEGSHEEADLGTQTRPFALALDRVRPAAVILRRDPAGVWRLERIPFEGELRLVELADLSVLGAEPFGTMITNETEAMFPLRDGRVAIAPVDGSAVRFIGPVPEAPVSDMAVVMRPGSSGGGILYTHPGPGGSHLTFRALTCNR